MKEENAVKIVGHVQDGNAAESTCTFLTDSMESKAESHNASEMQCT